MEGTAILLLCTFSLFSTLTTSSAVDIIRKDQIIRDGDTIISANNEFELGFFSTNISTNRYLGIWYKKKSYGTVVWVANGGTPLNSSTSGILRIDENGLLLFRNDSNNIYWSSNTPSSRSLKNPMAQLLDTGNFVFRDEEDSNEENFVWQSFDYPGNSLLPGMKIGVDFVTGMAWNTRSWKSYDDPSPGSFLHRLDTHGYPQLLLWKGSELHVRGGPWIGNQFSGDPVHKNHTIYENEFFIEQKEIYYTFRVLDGSSATSTTRLTLTPDGLVRRLLWNDQNQEWETYLTIMGADCDKYQTCGAYSTCNINSSPKCECLRGFDPKYPQRWEEADWTDGCVRRTPLDCGNGDGFNKYLGVKLPDTRHARYNLSMNLKECERQCLKNCNCTAYSNIDIEEGGKGCLLWFDELTDMKGQLEDGQDIYVRMPAAELEESKRSRKSTTMLIISTSIVSIAVAAFILVYLFKKRKLASEARLNLSGEEYLDLPLFNFRRIVGATCNFSQNNKIGEGGFGPVYKGTLEDGKEIAVKRLSKDSRQGIDEFKNEVSCIAKLQHRNLVALIGCCMEEGERILIYEYMPNKSLDSVIFDKNISRLMDWKQLYNIINGIARGLLYLHQDSKLRIIHRDLKASNVLLDFEMNPKISDFGMARIFGGSQTEANTTRVVGTFGYMPPEYAFDGLFSTKTDVYSFGVLVIEIVSGKRNRYFEHLDHSLNLLGHAWRCFNEEKLHELINGAILESSNHNEVCRVIQIGLLCVQQYPLDRPNMSQVVQMLNSRNAVPAPKQPGFFTERKGHERDYSTREPISSLSSITAVLPR